MLTSLLNLTNGWSSRPRLMSSSKSLSSMEPMVATESIWNRPKSLLYKTTAVLLIKLPANKGQIPVTSLAHSKTDHLHPLFTIVWKFHYNSISCAILVTVSKWKKRILALLEQKKNPEKLTKWEIQIAFGWLFALLRYYKALSEISLEILRVLSTNTFKVYGPEKVLNVHLN